MTPTTDGFLSVDQFDRVNLKTMAQGGLPAPYGQGDIFGALKVVQQWYIDEAPEAHTPEDALSKAVEWYCTSTNKEVVAAFVRFEENTLYQGTKILIDTMHNDPELFSRMIKDLSNGWKPGDPKSTD